jgi:murein DD-endopeptidase MepM/ murein hydrolase activator NlpD
MNTSILLSIAALLFGNNTDISNLKVTSDQTQIESVGIGETIGDLNGGFGPAPADKVIDTGGKFAWPALCTSITGKFNPKMSYWGIGCANKKGTPIYAADNGTVIKTSVSTWAEGYGNHIIIDHGNGIKTIYAHLYQIGVSEGQEVKRGQGIGLMGTTGRSTGPHLHFEVVIKGGKVDPMDYLN